MDKVTNIHANAAADSVGRGGCDQAVQAAVAEIANIIKVKPNGSWPDQPQQACDLVKKIRDKSGVSHEEARAAIGDAVRAFTNIGVAVLFVNCPQPAKQSG
jgi:hypothetical protein